MTKGQAPGDAHHAMEAASLYPPPPPSSPLQERPPGSRDPFYHPGSAPHMLWEQQKVCFCTSLSWKCVSALSWGLENSSAHRHTTHRHPLGIKSPHHLKR